MAKSSIHIEAGNAGFLSHNSRERPTKNSIFSDEKNECSISSKSAFEIYRKELAERAEKYTSRTGQKLQKKSVTHLSAIVNLNADHTLRDLRPLIEYIEERFGTKVFQAAIHRDEGHVGEDGKAIKNYHAHIEFMGLDQEGRSVRRKLTKKELSLLQEKTAEIMKMERGTNYAKERKRRPKRLDTYEYKEAMRRKESDRIDLTATLKREIADLRAELKERGAKRTQYAALEALNRSLKKQVKDKTLTVEAVQKQIADLRATITEKEEEIAELRANTIAPDYLKALESQAKRGKRAEETKKKRDDLTKSAEAFIQKELGARPTNKDGRFTLVAAITYLVAKVKDLKSKYEELRKRIIVNDNAVEYVRTPIKEAKGKEIDAAIEKDDEIEQDWSPPLAQFDY